MNAWQLFLFGQAFNMKIKGKTFAESSEWEGHPSAKLPSSYLRFFLTPIHPPSLTPHPPDMNSSFILLMLRVLLLNQLKALFLVGALECKMLKLAEQIIAFPQSTSLYVSALVSKNPQEQASLWCQSCASSTRIMKLFSSLFLLTVEWLSDHLLHCSFKFWLAVTYQERYQDRGWATVCGVFFFPFVISELLQP